MSSARSASSREQREAAEAFTRDKESVRSLSDWSPSASARSSRRSEYGPPTGRLRLDLSEVGGGGPVHVEGRPEEKKVPNKEKHRQLFCGSDDHQAATPSEQRATPSASPAPSGRSASTHTQRSDWTVFSAPTARSSARTVTARTATARSRCSQSSDSSRSDAKRSRHQMRSSAHRCSSTKVLPDVLKPISELSSSARRRLKIQIKASEKLQQKCKRSGDYAKAVLNLFRRCKPDEFGFVSRSQFVKGIRASCGVSKAEAKELFRYGDKKERNELNYKQFRRTLERMDASKKPQSAYKPVLRRKHVEREPNPLLPPNAHKLSRSFSDMTSEQREDHRNRNQIQRTIELRRHEIKEKFKSRRKENGSVMVRTKLTYGEVSKVLESFGIHMDAARLENMYRNKAKNESEGITFSQLARRTERYFNAAARGASAAADDLAVRNMTLKGQFLGSRAQGKGVASKNSESVDVSDFLAHHDRPSPSKARRSKGEGERAKREKEKSEQQGGGGDEEDEEKEKEKGLRRGKQPRGARCCQEAAERARACRKQRRVAFERSALEVALGR